MPRQYSGQFRERVLDLVDEGLDVAELGGEREISPATIYRWRKQSKVAAGEIATVNSAIAVELADARRRIRD